MPSKWERRISTSRPGMVYYFNVETKKSEWEKPEDFNDNVCVVRPHRPVSGPAGGSSLMPGSGSNQPFMKRTGLFEKVIGRPKTNSATDKSVQDINKFTDPTLKLRSKYNVDLCKPSCSKVRSCDDDSRSNSRTKSLLNLSRSYARLLPPTNTEPKTSHVSKTPTKALKRPSSSCSAYSRPVFDSKRMKRSRQSPLTNVQISGTSAANRTITNSAQESANVSSSSVPQIPSSTSDVNFRQARVHSWLNQLTDTASENEKPGFTEIAEEDMEVDERVNYDVFELRKGADNLQNAGCATLVLLNQEMEWAPGPSHTSWCEKELFLVLDTNILLQSLNFVNTIKDELIIPGYARPVLVIPWVVIQELDVLKDSRRKNIALKTELWACQAVKFINNLLVSKHPRLVCQRPNEEVDIGYQDTVNDDKVLSCAKSWNLKKPAADVIILTLDQNLQNKGMIMGLDIRNLQGFSTWVKSKTNKGPRSTSTQSVPAQRKRKLSSEGSSVDSDSRKLEAQLSDDIITITKVCMKNSLSVLLKKSMQENFDEVWLSVVFKKPPWSCLDVLLCYEKHWVAVFRYLYSRDVQLKLKDFIDLMRNQKKETMYSGNIRRVGVFVRVGKELLAMFANNAKYGKDELLSAISTLSEIYEMADKHWNKSITLNVCAALVQSILHRVGESQAEIEIVEESTGQDSASVVQNLPNIYTEQNVLTGLEESREDVLRRVTEVFQTCWEIIAKTNEHLTVHLTPEIRQDQVERRQEVIFEFRNLMQYLWPLKNAYERMLNTENLAPESEILKALADCLNRFAVNFAGAKVWQNVTGPQLFVFYQQQWPALDVGCKQLLCFIDQLGDLLNNRLLPSEQTIVKEVT